MMATLEDLLCLSQTPFSPLSNLATRQFPPPFHFHSTGLIFTQAVECAAYGVPAEAD